MLQLALYFSSKAFQVADDGRQKVTCSFCCNAAPLVNNNCTAVRRIHRQASRWVEGHTLAVCFPPYAVKTVLLLGP